MGSETSEQVMELLKELAVLKELNKAYEASPTEGEHEAYRLRQTARGWERRSFLNMLECFFP